MHAKLVLAGLILTGGMVFSSCQKSGCPAYKHRVIPSEQGSPFSFRKKKKTKVRKTDRGLFGNSGIKR